MCRWWCLRNLTKLIVILVSLRISFSNSSFSLAFRKWPVMVTNLKNILSEKRSVILERWVDQILDTYPSDTASFMRDKKADLQSCSHSISRCWGHLRRPPSGNWSGQGFCISRQYHQNTAIQDFTPSQAISFVFFLKKIIRDELAAGISEKSLADEMIQLEAQIDSLDSLRSTFLCAAGEAVWYQGKWNEKHDFILCRKQIWSVRSRRRTDVQTVTLNNFKRKEVNKWESYFPSHSNRTGSACICGSEDGEPPFSFRSDNPLRCYYGFHSRVIYRVVGWGRSPVPFRIPTTCGQMSLFPGSSRTSLKILHHDGSYRKDAARSAVFPLPVQEHKTEFREGPKFSYALTNGFGWQDLLSTGHSLLSS